MATTVYGASQVTAMSYRAFVSGSSSQGNQLAAPMGCEAMSDPLVSSSHPSSPHFDFTGPGLPE